MTTQNHIIHRINLDIGAPPGTDGHRLQDMVLHILNDTILPRLGKEIDALDTGSEHIRISELNLDLGEIRKENLEEELPIRLQQQLMLKIMTCTGTAGNPFRPEQAGRVTVFPEIPAEEPERSIKAEILAPERLMLDIIIYYLKTGQLPWYCDGSEMLPSGEAITGALYKLNAGERNQLKNSLAFDNEALTRLILQYDLTVVNEVLTLLLAPTAGMKMETLKKAVATLTEGAALTIAEKQIPSDQQQFPESKILHLRNIPFKPELENLPEITDSRDRKEQPADKPGTSTDLLKNFLTFDNDALTRLYLQFDRTVVNEVRSILLAPAADMKMTILKKGVSPLMEGAALTAAEKQIPSEQQQFQESKIHPHKDLPLNPQMEDPPEITDSQKRKEQVADKPEPSPYHPLPAEGVLVTHAGLIILHPFVEYLFREFGMLEGDRFRDGESRLTAVQLLGYLATGEDDLYEYDLLLEKYLCGVGYDIPLRRKSLLTPAMKTEAGNLLNAAISHWKKLKNTSPDGLRQGFLVRRGKLAAGTFGHRLLVEKAPQDLLLSWLPWGISLIKLPWLSDVLHVEWN